MSDFFDLTPQQQEQRLQAVGQAALANWQLDGAQLRLIKYRENCVFEVNHEQRRYALRIHRYGYHSDDALRSELKWMAALADSGIQVPALVPTHGGEPFAVHVAPDLPGPLQIDLFEWVSGNTLGSFEEGIADPAEITTTYHTMGQLAAAVHNQSSQWQPPADFTRHAWDADGLAGSAPFWGPFWNLAAATDAQRHLLSQARDEVYRQLHDLPRTPQVYSMIHADFVPENLMRDEGGIRLIDFDDAGFGWHLFELATSLYFIFNEPYYQSAYDALIAGYRQTRPLEDDQLALMPLFLTARSFTYLGWVHTRQETETARELTPMLLDGACQQAEILLAQ